MDRTSGHDDAYRYPRRRRRRLQTEDCDGVTGGCATLGTCNEDGYEADCAAPNSYVCEHQLPGLNICESPPLSAMLPCWMSGVDGALRLNQISIPGTHDTMAKGVSACLQSGLANYVHTQVCVCVRTRKREEMGKEGGGGRDKDVRQ